MYNLFKVVTVTTNNQYCIMYLSLNDLPRDVVLNVIKHFDMEARIKTNIIGKLYVPDTVTYLIERVISQKKDNFKRRKEHNISGHVVTFPLPHDKYYECYYDDSDHNMYWYCVEFTNGQMLPKLTCLFCG